VNTSTARRPSSLEGEMSSQTQAAPSASSVNDQQTTTRGWRAWLHSFRPASAAFWGVHAAAVIGAIACFSWKGVLLAVVSYFVRMVLVTAAYHRYFSHRSFKTSRWFQFVLALGAQSSAQKGVLWWAGHHRHHHKYSDEPEDIHSVRRSGLWHSHIGWILDSPWDHTNTEMITDPNKSRPLRFLNHRAANLLPAAALAAAFALIGGWSAFVWGFLVSTVLLWHGSFSINSLSHLFGKRRYPTSDDSRNNWALALLTAGEGWHNNHHHYQSSANQGFRWWEIDVTFYVLRLLSVFGLVWDLRRPPRAVVTGS